MAWGFTKVGIRHVNLIGGKRLHNSHKAVIVQDGRMILERRLDEEGYDNMELEGVVPTTLSVGGLEIL